MHRARPCQSLASPSPTWRAVQSWVHDLKADKGSQAVPLTGCAAASGQPCDSPAGSQILWQAVQPSCPGVEAQADKHMLRGAGDRGGPGQGGLGCRCQGAVHCEQAGQARPRQLRHLRGGPGGAPLTPAFVECWPHSCSVCSQQAGQACPRQLRHLQGGPGGPHVCVCVCVCACVCGSSNGQILATVLLLVSEQQAGQVRPQQLRYLSRGAGGGPALPWPQTRQMLTTVLQLLCEQQAGQARPQQLRHT